MKTWTTHHVVLRFYCNGTWLDWAGHERFLSTSTNQLAKWYIFLRFILQLVNSLSFDIPEPFRAQPPRICHIGNGPHCNSSVILACIIMLSILTFFFYLKLLTIQWQSIPWTLSAKAETSVVVKILRRSSVASDQLPGRTENKARPISSLVVQTASSSFQTKVYWIL